MIDSLQESPNHGQLSEEIETLRKELLVLKAERDAAHQQMNTLKKTIKALRHELDSNTNLVQPHENP